MFAHFCVVNEPIARAICTRARVSSQSEHAAHTLALVQALSLCLSTRTQEPAHGQSLSQPNLVVLESKAHLAAGVEIGGARTQNRSRHTHNTKHERRATTTRSFRLPHLDRGDA